MNNTITSIAACALLMLASCSNPRMDKAKAFAASFANDINDGNTESVVAVYPDAEYAEDLALDYIADSVTINETGQPDELEISYGNGTSLTVEIPDDASSVKVISSTGLFKYPGEKLSFARKVGAINGNITDKTLAERMVTVENLSTALFNDYAASRKNAIKNLGFTVTKDIEFAVEEGKGYYTLKNTTDQPISGDDYQIALEWTSMGPGYEETNIEMEKGKDIPAGGTVRIPQSFTGHIFSDIKAITMKTPAKEDFFKNYEPTGKEYADYVAKHGAKVDLSNKLSDGPYKLAGKLGGKYAVHVSLEKGMVKGSYYYDKSGPSATLNLSIKSFNPRTGDLTIEETNDKGEVTGTFTGILTAESYTGKMTAFTGKTYNFTLAVE